MKLQILSDLHVDTHEMPLTLGTGDCDLVLVAGDWANGKSVALQGYVGAPNPRGVPVLALLGNHEWYRFDVQRTEDFQILRKQASASGIWILDRSRYEFDGWTILGCTLWTNFELQGKEMWPYYGQIAKRGISDFRFISFQGRPIQPHQMRALYWRDHAWLEEQLRSCDPAKTVVATHFGPHRNSCHPVYADAPDFWPYFINHTELIERYQPALWVHGHTHECLDYQVGETRVVCNVRGYGGEKQLGHIRFRPDLVIDL